MAKLFLKWDQEIIHSYLLFNNHNFNYQTDVGSNRLIYFNRKLANHFVMISDIKTGYSHNNITIKKEAVS